MYTGLYTLAMITTLMAHLRIGPYKEGVLIAQIQMPFHTVGRSFPYELLVIYSRKEAREREREGERRDKRERDRKRDR